MESMTLPAAVITLIDLALEEDLSKGDVASLCIDPNLEAKAKIITKEDIIVSGTDVVRAIVEKATIQSKKLQICVQDRALATKHSVLLHIEGNARSILGIERTLLNFLQRTCSVATLAAAYKRKTSNSNVRILDTRKTIPAWRYLDKRSVHDGGLWNHRHNLGSQILIKENHIIAAGSIKNAILSLRKTVSHDQWENAQVEITNIKQAQQAIELGIQSILLDNFTAKELKAIVPEIRTIKKDILLEASGRINISNIEEYIETGVDRISVGALTHSVRAVDLSMLLNFPTRSHQET